MLIVCRRGVAGGNVILGTFYSLDYQNYSYLGDELLSSIYLFLIENSVCMSIPEK